MKRLAPDNRGMIIVFTVILLAVFLTTALSFSYFIIGDINKARAVDNSIIAYYAADAGMEESLYLLKKQGLSDIDQLKLARLGSRQLPASSGEWNITSSTNYERAVLRQRLYSGQGAKLFILNRGAATNPNTTKSLVLVWHKGANMSPQLQVSLTQLTPDYQSSTLVYFTDRAEIEVADTESSGGIAKCYDLKDTTLAGLKLTGAAVPDYVAEFKVLSASSTSEYVDDILVRANNNSCGTEAEFNAQGITNLTIKAQGSYGKSTQNIFAHILPLDPVSGVLNFVLFSEQDVVKE